MTESGYDHHVKVWHRQSPTRVLSNESWDKISIYAIETFGLPGVRYITDISMDRMVWSFKDPKDALMFKLRWSEVAQ